MPVLDRIAEGLLIGLILLAPLPYGSVGPTAVLFLTLVVALISLCLFPWSGIFTLKPRRPPWILGASFLLAALPLLPLPIRIARLLSPSAAGLRDGMPGGGPSWISMSVHPDATIVALARLGVFAGLFLASAALSRQRTAGRRILWAVFISGLFQAAYGSAEFLSGHQHIFFSPKRYYTADATGTLVNKNHFAGILEMALGVGLGLFLDHLWTVGGTRRHARGFRSRFLSFLGEEGGRTAILSLGIAVIMLGLLLSHSRSGLASAALGFLIIAAADRRREGGASRKSSLLLAGGVIVLVLLVTGIERIVTEPMRLASPETLVQGRLPVWRDAVLMLARYPLFGTGLGTFRDIYPLYRTMRGEFLYDHVHNDYLELAVETGLPGLVGALFLLFLLSRVLVRGLRSPTLAEIPALAGAMAGLLALLVHETTDFNLHLPANAAHFAALAGAAVGLAAAHRKPLALVRHEPSSPHGVGTVGGRLSLAGVSQEPTRPVARRTVPVPSALGSLTAIALLLALLVAYLDDRASRLLSRYRELAAATGPQSTAAGTNDPGEPQRHFGSEDPGPGGDQALSQETSTSVDRIQILRRAVATRLRSAEARAALAVEISVAAAAGEGGEWGEALAEARAAILANPADADGWLAGYRVAALASFLGHLPASEESAPAQFLEGAVRCDPRSGILRRKVASALLSMGDHPKAAEQIGIALRDSSIDPRATVVRMLAEGMPPADLVDALPARFAALYEAGIALSEAGHQGEAERAWLGAARSDPASPLPWISLCRTTEVAGRRRDAIEYARRGLASAGSHSPQSRSELSFCAAIAGSALGQTAAALTDARNALEDRPRDAMIRDLVARLRLASGDAAGAVEDWRFILEKLPDNGWLRENRGAIRRRLGSAYDAMKLPAAALDQYIEALRLDPSDTEAKAGIERLTAADRGSSSR